MADDKPIIIVKKKGGHAAHHGGAWKVAYADFVTAMMAFFMVMWLLNAASAKTRQNIASYFRKPGIFAEGSGNPLLMGEAGILTDGYVPPHPEDVKQLYNGAGKVALKEKTGTDSSTTGDKRITYRGTDGKRDSVPDDDAAQRGFQSDQSDTKKIAVILSPEKKGYADSKSKEEGSEEAEEKKAEVKKAEAELKRELEQSPEINAMLGAIQIKAELDGVTIEIMDTDKTSMFQAGSARILPDAEAAFAKVTPILNKYSHKIDVIGHTDSSGFSRRPGGYSNWELSADRANAARRLLEKNGVTAERFVNVTGRADRELKFPSQPAAPGNRRISLKLVFDDKAIRQPLDEEARKVIAPNDKETPPGDATNDLFEQTPGSDTSSPATTLPTNTVAAASTPVVPLPTPTTAPLTADDLLDPVKRARRERIKIPNEPPPTDNPAPASGNKIFTDAPVIGPRDPFANLE